LREFSPPRRQERLENQKRYASNIVVWALLRFSVDPQLARNSNMKVAIHSLYQISLALLASWRRI
jgi:hypothetical protein